MFDQKISLSNGTGRVSRAELVTAFSHALDITEGQPAGHCVRSCWIGFHIGRAMGLSQVELHDLYYTLLLKDLGCSSNAARICELYVADDRAFKRGYKTVGTSLAATLYFVLRKTAQGRPLRQRVAAVGNILRNGDVFAQELILARCTRGAAIARSLRFPEAVCEGIFRLDEHWDGSGRPGGLRGDQIPILSRIALLAQVIDVFNSHAGPNAALDEAGRRAGVWFDPALVEVFEHLAGDGMFWGGLQSPFLDSRVRRLVGDEGGPVDADYLDDITAAFGQVIDCKSPYTAGHSERVAKYADGIAENFGFSKERRRWLRRAAYLHDIGKLGVSNSILDKPARLTTKEWEEVREHASHTRVILSRIGVFGELADIAAAHHERLDGAGYPLGLKTEQIAPETRIITVCDYYDALTADRPYRSAMSPEKAFKIMEGEIGRAIDADCLESLQDTVQV